MYNCTVTLYEHAPVLYSVRSDTHLGILMLNVAYSWILKQIPSCTICILWKVGPEIASYENSMKILKPCGILVSSFPTDVPGCVYNIY